MRKLLKMLTVLLLLQSSLYAQDRNFWSKSNPQTAGNNLFAGRQQPRTFALFQLNEQALKAQLAATPSEKSVSVTRSSFIITVPNAKGDLEQYRVVDAPVMDPALAARYPDIHSYAGVGVDNPVNTIRFSFSPLGFSGMLLSPNRSSVYINKINGNYYSVVSRSELSDQSDRFECLTNEAIGRVQTAAVGSEALRNANDGRLRTYRLALCASGEYSQAFLNGTETSDAERKTKVLAALNAAMTRTNGIYERDFGVRMVLVANNDAVIYLNASTDPFTTVGSWNSQTQTTCDNVIGSANYDIGHGITFQAPPGNGNAGCIGCVCIAGSKGSGWTAYYDFASDFFVVDFLTHEMGHQFGANHTHTYAGSSEGTGVQAEPGSGTTIMGYAGITGATTDVQPHSDDYFHSRSIEQITNYIKSTNGGCAVTTITGNATPTAAAGTDFTIPRSTPFILTGTGSDADAANVLSYCWEQIDSRATGFSTVPSATATAGPQFRSYLPVNNGSRTFPRLSSILDGTNANRWEVLPSVARTLNFRMTVRDNNPGGGNNASDDMIVTISSAAGPFAVTAPNTAVSWNVSTSQTVTWSVNGSNAAPVNCANVKISLSTDGGLSFPTVLAASTPNDGTEIISVPNVNATTCRIKVEAVGNIFFDISNVNFTIGGTPPACGDATGLAASAITNTSATVSWNSVTDAISYDVDYKAASDATWINAATATTATSVSLSGLTQGTVYDWRVRATCAAGTGNYVATQFTTTAPCGTPASLTSSAITSSGATVSWAAVSGATSYTVEYKTTSATTWTTAAASTTANSVNITGLSATTTYDWRVRATCASGPGAFATAQFTTTAVSTCPGIYDVSTNGNASGAAQIPLNTDVRGLINPSGDNDYYKFTITTSGTATITLSTLPADYDMRIYNTNGTSQLAISQNGGTTNETNTRTYSPGTYFVRVYGYQNANNATQCYTLRVATGTATRAVEQPVDVITIYPNPVRNELSINANGNGEALTINVFDMFGKRVLTKQTAGSTKLGTEKLGKGVYLVTVTNAKGQVIKQEKVVKD
jgi:Metallo-peptidase family M12B Reprolysin-like/Secretion system C-terminal sorting domain/Fibronectin type III domain/Bacterial pre-peptidase C-terminal domain